MGEQYMQHVRPETSRYILVVHGRQQPFHPCVLLHNAIFEDTQGLNGPPTLDATPSRGVQIEEVHEDGTNARPTRQQPIVEEPDGMI